jgi:hypothetical protein
MDKNRYFYELLIEKRSAANKAQNQAEKAAAKEARRVRTGKPTGSKRGKDSYDGRTLHISGKSGKPGTGEGGVAQRRVTGKGSDDEAYSESTDYENLYYQMIGESIYNTYATVGSVLAEALGLLSEKRAVHKVGEVKRNQPGGRTPSGKLNVPGSRGEPGTGKGGRPRMEIADDGEGDTYEEVPGEHSTGGSKRGVKKKRVGPTGMEAEANANNAKFRQSGGRMR